MSFTHHHLREIFPAPDNEAATCERRQERDGHQAAIAILRKARADISRCLGQPVIPPSLKKFFTSATLDGMKTRRVEGDRTWLTTQALPDVYEHIRAVRDEFTGQPEIHFYHAALIVKIRRQADLTESLLAFRSLWEGEGMGLLKTLSSRWIISALDTFVDQGQAAERAGAMTIVTFVNMLKMAETEYRLCGQRHYDAAAIDNNRENYPALWDGMRVFHLPDDDTFANMIRRMRKTLAATPFFALAFETLLNKIVHENTMLTRLARHHLRNLW